MDRDKIDLSSIQECNLKHSNISQAWKYPELNSRPSGIGEILDSDISNYLVLVF